mgnify:FL=1
MDQPIDSLIFSVTFENYIKNIKQDKSDKKLGKWNISEAMHPQLKYAYVYLKDSDQMIVKKYYINHFVAEEDKWCFVFDKSEDVFFEYPHSRVQARHYRSSNNLDAVMRLEEGELKRRLEKSRTIKAEAGTSYKKTSGFFEPAREQLIKIRNEKFKDNPMPNAVVARTLIKLVEDGEDADAVLTEYYLSTPKN